MTITLIPLHMTAQWSEVLEAIREKAQEDSKSVDLTNFNITAILAAALSDCYAKARWRASTVCDSHGLFWKALTDQNRAKCIMVFIQAYVDAISDRFDEIEMARRERSDA